MSMVSVSLPAEAEGVERGLVSSEFGVMEGEMV